MLKTGIFATIYYVFTLICVGLFLLRDTWYYAITLNYFGFFILLIALSFLIIMLKRNQYLRLVILGWALLFLVKNSLPIIGMILEHSHTRFQEADMHSLTNRLIRFGLTIIVLLGVFVFTEKADFAPDEDSIQDLEE